MTTTADQVAVAYDDAIDALLRATPKGWYAQRGTARAAVTYAGVASLNMAYDRSLAPDLGALDELATEVGRRAVPWSIMIRGEASEEVADLAARHGLLGRGEVPMMACATRDVVVRTGTAKRDLVRRVGAAEADLYTDVLTKGFDAPEGLFGQLMGGGVLDADPITGYLGEKGGQAVGTGLGVLTSGVVGVFNVAVVPAARGRGLGRALTEVVLLDGIAAGADAAYLHASAMGRPLYESMGFRLVESWTVFEAL